MVPLPSDKYLSFFGVIKSAFEAQQDKEGELSKKECSSSTWLKAKKDWVELTLSALLYLSAEVGGQDRDSEVELLVLCNHWLETLDRALVRGGALGVAGVRDATSRLPNGEGTRIDLCILVRDSQYLQETVSDTQLNNAVSGALDRLHYEKDPCVRYDNARKLWIYLHRGRSEEEFELIHWASEVAAKQRKYFMMSRPKIKPTQATPPTQSGSKTAPVAIVSSGGKQVVVAGIMSGKTVNSSNSHSTPWLWYSKPWPSNSQLSLQLGGVAHEGKGAAQLSLDAAQLLTQLIAAKSGVSTGLSGLGSFSASIGGAGGGSAGVNVGGVSAGAVGVTGKGGVSASGGGGGGVVPPQQEWLTESEEEGMPVGDRDDWEDSESD
ncbi:hypothetical protein EMCRGX_G011966 [Ephydatia muelleri]